MTDGAAMGVRVKRVAVILTDSNPGSGLARTSIVVVVLDVGEVGEVLEPSGAAVVVVVVSSSSAIEIGFNEMVSTRISRSISSRPKRNPRISKNWPSSARLNSIWNSRALPSALVIAGGFAATAVRPTPLRWARKVRSSRKLGKEGQVLKEGVEFRLVRDARLHLPDGEEI